MLKKTLIIISLSAVIFLAACTKNLPEPQMTPPAQEATNNESSLTRNICGEYTDQK